MREAGIPDSDIEAEKLLCHAFAVDPAWLYANSEAVLPADRLRVLSGHLQRRVRREPLAYITGSASFYGREFAVDRRVLIPRPETELLVELAVQFVGEAIGEADDGHGRSPDEEGRPLDERSRPPTLRGRPPLRVADIGTGSGILAITLALELSSADVRAVDVSADALEVARKNATVHGVEDRIHFHQGDLASPLSGTFDIVVANLPYVRSDDLPGLHPELRMEPRSALDGGADGLKFIGPLIDDLPRLMGRPGIALLEIDPPIASRAFEHARMKLPGARVSVSKDLAGLDRVIEITL